MKKFRFRFESFFRYKKYLERKAQVAVAKAIGDIKACEIRIDTCKTDYNKAKEDLDRESTSGMESNRYQLHTAYLTAMEYLIESEKEHRKELLKTQAKKQKELAEKSIEKKVLENFKNREQTRYYTDMMKSLQKETDDTIIIRKAREINR